jgi:hypothetical protein
MRFVRHGGMPEWGLGVVLDERGCALDIVFETAGYKRITPGFAKLVGVPDADVPPEHPLRSREHESALVRTDARRRRKKRV